MSAETYPNDNSNREVMDDTLEFPMVKYDKFQQDALRSGELLDLIHQENRRQLDDSGFTLHFLDALKNVAEVNHNGKVFVAQRNPNDGTRIVQAVLLQDDSTGKNNRIYRVVGREQDGTRTPATHFDEDDLNLAIAQLDDLQLMKDMGMISLDTSLSVPVKASRT